MHTARGEDTGNTHTPTLIGKRLAVLICNITLEAGVGVGTGGCGESQERRREGEGACPLLPKNTNMTSTDLRSRCLLYILEVREDALSGLRSHVRYTRPVLRITTRRIFKSIRSS